MKSLDKETNLSPTPLECSAQLVELTPVVMLRIRGEMRRRTVPGLSIQQFRALNYLRRHPQSSLSHLANYLELTLPSTSKLVQQLVDKQVITRNGAADRRRISLSLTQTGISAFTAASLQTQEQLAAELTGLTQTELATLSKGLQVLSKALVGGAARVNLP
jgi:DNA-binding MarR family transcriptional regulator